MDIPEVKVKGETQEVFKVVVTTVVSWFRLIGQEALVEEVPKRREAKYLGGWWVRSLGVGQQTWS
jgi:hypothetical protein